MLKPLFLSCTPARLLQIQLVGVGVIIQLQSAPCCLRLLHRLLILLAGVVSVCLMVQPGRSSAGAGCLIASLVSITASTVLCFVLSALPVAPVLVLPEELAVLFRDQKQWFSIKYCHVSVILSS